MAIQVKITSFHELFTGDKKRRIESAMFNIILKKIFNKLLS